MKQLQLNELQLGDYIVYRTIMGYKYAKVKGIFADRIQVDKAILKPGDFYPMKIVESVLDRSFPRVTRKTWVINGQWQVLRCEDGKYGVGHASKIVETFPVLQVFEDVHELQHFLKANELPKVRISGMTYKMKYYEDKYGKAV